MTTGAGTESTASRVRTSTAPCAYARASAVRALDAAIRSTSRRIRAESSSAGPSRSSTAEAAAATAPLSVRVDRVGRGSFAGVSACAAVVVGAAGRLPRGAAIRLPIPIPSATSASAASPCQSQERRRSWDARLTRNGVNGPCCRGFRRRPRLLALRRQGMRPRRTRVFRDDQLRRGGSCRSER